MQIKHMPTFTTKIVDRDVTGIYSVFGNIDAYTDVGMAGSFTKTIKERGNQVLHLWSHQHGEPPTAIIKSLREVGRNELPDAAKALYPEATGGAEVTREYLTTPRADEVYLNIKAGAPLQMSYGYDPIKVAFEQRDGMRVRLLQEQKLFETSDCNFGANDATAASKSLATPSASKLRRTLHQIKSMDGYDLWSECYDVYGACSAVQAIAMLLDDECDDPAQMAQLIGALRLLLAFIGGEIDGIEAMGSQAAAGDMQLASRLISNVKMQIKVGARHSTSDQTMINAVHTMACDLGATNCAGDSSTSGDKSRADPPVGASLTLMRSKLAFLDFAIKE